MSPCRVLEKHIYNNKKFRITVADTKDNVDKLKNGMRSRDVFIPR